MSARRQFSLSLKGKASTGERMKTDSSTEHGSSSSTVPTPDSIFTTSNSSNDTRTDSRSEGELPAKGTVSNISDGESPSDSHSRPLSDVSGHLRATEQWFNTAATDEDSSVPGSPTEADWQRQSSLHILERAKDALQQDPLVSPLPAPAVPVPESVSTATKPTHTERTPKRSPTKESIQNRGTSPSSKRLPSNLSGSTSNRGIIGRLKRISKREKRESALPPPSDSDFQVLFPVADTEDDNEAPTIYRARSKRKPVPVFDDVQEPYDTMKQQSLHQQTKDSLDLRDAGTERIPQFGLFRNQSIHSVEPSVVDDESVADRDSPPGSPFGLDEAEGGEEEELNVVGRISLSSAEESSDSRGSHDWNMEGVPDPVSLIEKEEQSAIQVSPAPFSEASLPVTESGPLPPDSEDDNKQSAPVTPLIDVQSPTSQIHDLGDEEGVSNQSHHPADSRDTSAQSLRPEESDDEDEDAPTPRAIAEPERTSYFDGGTQIDSFESTVEQPEDAWLDRVPLSAEARHCFVRQMITQEFSWEAERLFLLNTISQINRPSPSSEMPRSDIGYLKSKTGDMTPNLPILRFLFRNIVLTCPIFGGALPIEGAAAERARNVGGTKFLNDGLLPLVRFIHANSISRGVDVHGEWPLELFNAPSTLGVMQAGVFKLLTRLITAFVDRKGKSLSWSKVPPPPPSKYLSHRVTLTQLKQGGYEVNVVGARIRASPRECEFLLSVKRFGYPPTYVIRTENDFYTFARSLAQELGPQSRIRPVPPPAEPLSQLVTDKEETAIDAGLAKTSTGSNKWSSVKLAPRDQLYNQIGASGSTSSLQALTPPAPPVPRAEALSTSARARTNQTESSDPVGRISSHNRSTASLSSIKSNKATTETETSPRLPSMSRERSSSRIFSHKSSKTASSIDLAASNPVTLDEEIRRKQVRAWLRDALSVRGAGHANETLSFLHAESFGERDLKAATRRDVQIRQEIDDATMQDRESITAEAPQEILELRHEMKQLAYECIENDGLISAWRAVQQHETFGSLPLPYQRFVSWTNLQVASFLHHTFLNSHEARRNFDRFQELVQSIPWKSLSTALREPTGLMLQKVLSSFQDDFVYKKLLAVMLEDVPPRKVTLELDHLKKRLGSTILRKLEAYTNSLDWQKKIVRRAAEQADIPLVAAIVRGSDKPLLAAEGIKRIVSATKVYQEFMQTKPTYAERKSKIKANVDVRLIVDMQRALQLLCQQRDGRTIRKALHAELKPVIQTLIDPILQLLKRLHRSKILNRGPQHDIVIETQRFCYKLLDVLAGLRVRIQDPWRSLGTLTLLLDDAVPSWYRLLHNSAKADTLLYDFAQWMQGIASLLRSYDDNERDLLASLWPKPSSSSPQRQDYMTKGSPERNVVDALLNASQNKRMRQMETACRWAAGDADADLGIQLMGEGGKTRTTPNELPFIAGNPPARKLSVLNRFREGLRGALSKALESSTPGTAW